MPAVIDYAAKVKHDGIVYKLHLPSLEIPRCQTCGETYSTNAVDEQVRDALRAHLRLLTPVQIRQQIKKLGLKQQHLAQRLGVAPETISRWRNGALIQSRAMDNLLRLYFAIPEVRKALCGGGQDPQLGTADEVFEAQVAPENENILALPEKKERLQECSGAALHFYISTDDQENERRFKIAREAVMETAGFPRGSQASSQGNADLQKAAPAKNTPDDFLKDCEKVVKQRIAEILNSAVKDVLSAIKKTPDEPLEQDEMKTIEFQRRDIG